MALREFSDGEGRGWRVWNVHPARGYSSSRAGGERRRRAGAYAGEERRGHERRHLTLTLPGLERGWLCFEAGEEKRRMSPIPDDWESCPPERLDAYRARATPVKSRRIVRRPAPVLETPPEP
jgi:hypothetical protein